MFLKRFVVWNVDIGLKVFLCFSVWRAKARLWTCLTLRTTRPSLSSLLTSRDSGSTGPTRSVDTKLFPHSTTLFIQETPLNPEPPECLKLSHLSVPKYKNWNTHQLTCMCSNFCIYHCHNPGPRVCLPQRPHPWLFVHPCSQRGQREDGLLNADHHEAEEGCAANRRAGNRQDGHD